MDKSADCVFEVQKCKQKCLKKLSMEFIKSSRYRFWTKDYQQRVEWFCDKFIEADFIGEKIKYAIGIGNYACGFCFKNLYKIDKNFYYKWIRHVRRFNHGSISSGFRKGRPVARETEDASLWLSEYSQYRGDHLPVKSIIELPYKTRKNDIYKCYLEEQTENMRVSVSRSSFYTIWKTRFTNLKIKQTNSFSRCSTCTTLTTRIEKTRDGKEREELKKKILAHNNRQM